MEICHRGALPGFSLWQLKTLRTGKTSKRGALGFSDIGILFWSVFRFLCQKTSVFRFWCSMRFADFSFFSIWFSVFVKNTSGFSDLVPNVVFGFSYFFSYLALFVYTVLYAVFGFGWFCLRFWMNFSSVLRFLVYPNAPLIKDAIELGWGRQISENSGIAITAVIVIACQ